MSNNDIIVINETPFKIELENIPIPEDGGDTVFGHYTLHNTTIILNKNANEWVQWDTLWHEMIHIISEDLRLGFNEKTVCRLSKSLAGTAHRNIELLEFRNPKDDQCQKQQ